MIHRWELMEAREKQARAEREYTRLAEAAADVLDEWDDSEWIRPNFESALARLRDVLGQGHQKEHEGDHG